MLLDVSVESAVFIQSLSLGCKYVSHKIKQFGYIYCICRSDPCVLLYKYLCNLCEYVHSCGLQSVQYINRIVTDIKM